MGEKKYTLLCLGDSYTIGEAVLPEDSFPFQAVKLLAEKKNEFEDPKIIAVTGWTTDELQSAIREADIHKTFDFVTLLIGVNNQYRNRDLENYKTEFSELLQTAISFADGKLKNVIVISIPDWSVT
ncbi:MAG TPA: GDSL-type esterase/lipase family protein, partial [Chitinophagales bacterium]